MKIKLFTVFTLFINFYSLKAQDVSTHYIDIDSIKIQLDIYKENELVLSSFKNRLNEKVSLMVLKFQNNYKDFLKKYEYSENHILIEKIKKQLEK